MDTPREAMLMQDIAFLSFTCFLSFRATDCPSTTVFIVVGSILSNLRKCLLLQRSLPF